MSLYYRNVLRLGDTIAPLLFIMALEIEIQNVCMDTRSNIFLKAVTLWDASMALSSWEEGLRCARGV
jgi:hypothetical protein